MIFDEVGFFFGSHVSRLRVRDENHIRISMHHTFKRYELIRRPCIFVNINTSCLTNQICRQRRENPNPIINRRKYHYFFLFVFRFNHECFFSLGKFGFHSLYYFLRFVIYIKDFSQHIEIFIYSFYCSVWCLDGFWCKWSDSLSQKLLWRTRRL